MIVDVHTHLWDNPEQMGSGTAKRLRLKRRTTYEQLDTSTSRYDEAMGPVTRSIILGFHSKYLNASIPHEQVARYVGRNPKKYVGFAGIDPMADGYLDSLKSAVDQGLKGVLISPAAQGFHPAHTEAMLLYEECQNRGMPVMVHPGTHMDTASVMDYSQPHLLDEIGRTFPELRLVVAQVGHPWAEQTLWLIGKHPHFYADLSDLSQRPWQLYNVLLLASQMQVTNHLLLGSDFPFSTPQQAIVNIYSVNEHARDSHLPTIPRDQLRQIVERDALAALGLAEPTPTEPEPAAETEPEGDR